MKRCPKCGKQYPDDANFCPTDAGHLETVAEEGAPVAPVPAVDTAGHEILAGRFALGDELGGTRTGVVHAAADKQSAAPCVVKLVDPAVFPTSLIFQRTERELKQLERCKSEHVARVLDHGKKDDALWIASERAPGKPLSTLVAESGPLSEERTLAIAVQIAGALEDTAKLGVIHRDLAPKNVLVGDGDRVKLINFGVPVPPAGGTKVQGVPEYVAPEQVEGKPVDQRCNIYSLGAIAYFALTGAPPFSGDAAAVHAAHLSTPPAPPSSAAKVSPAVEQLILKALEKSSSKRFMTLRQLLGDAEQAALGEAGPAPAATAPMGKLGSPAAPIVADSGVGKGKDVSDNAKTLMGMPAFDVNGAPVNGEAAAAPAVQSESIPAPAPAPAAEPQPAEAVPQPIESAPAPAPAAPAVAPAAPTVASQPSGKKAKVAPKPADTSRPKSKFRETMWFKKGELDEAAAQAAAKKSDDFTSDKADEMAIDERYKDDGTLSQKDEERLSLRTGATQMMDAVTPADVRRAQVSEADLVSEMRSGRTLIVAGIVVALIALIAVVAYFAG